MSLLLLFLTNEGGEPEVDAIVIEGMADIIAKLQALLPAPTPTA
jgi:hypothetical protein